MEIQEQMSERAMELLLLPEETPCFVLDIGCGSGLSGTVLEENGHCWVGMDISQAMLGIIEGLIKDLRKKIVETTLEFINSCHLFIYYLL